MNAQFTCMYCGNEWERDWYGSGSPSCSKCGDKRVKRRKTGARVDYYADDPQHEEVRVSHEFED